MPQPRRLFVHVGLQKTGTSYLQGVLRDNAEDLATQGLDLVPPSRRESFDLMLVVRQRFNPTRDPGSAADALTRFTGRLEEAPGRSAILSQESLAACRPDQVRRLLDACGDREVHCVVTARDLARGLPSSWQQELKSGRTPGWQEWLTRLREGQQAVAEGRRAGHPWIHLDPVSVLSRWGEQLPPERLHLVTVPPAGSSPTLLLERFCAVLGVEPSGLQPPERAANTSLGREQAELLRRVNLGLPDHLRRRQVYGDVGKRFFASQVLADQRGSRILVPSEARAWCEEVAETQVRDIGASAWHVAGDLADLRPRAEAFSDGGDQPGEDEVAQAAVEALVRMLTLRSRGVLRRRRAVPGEGAPVRVRLRRRLARVVRRRLGA